MSDKVLRCVVIWLAISLVVPCLGDTLLADRFGVFPTVEYVEWVCPSSGDSYSGYTFNLDSLAPTKNVDSVNYQIDDWFGYWDPNDFSTDVVDYPGTGTRPEGGEPYDTSAYYFDDSHDKLYFATIMGFHSPEDGIWGEQRLGGFPVVQGDFAIDLGRPGSQEDGFGFRYNYGVNITPEERPDSLEDNVMNLYGDFIGTDVYRTTDGWYLGTPIGAVNPENSDAFTNFDPSWNDGTGMTKVGEAEVAWYQLYNGDDPLIENNWPVWVIEISIPRHILPRLTPGDEVQFRWLAGCRNDGNGGAFLTGEGTTVVPEPGTAVLFALGAGPLAIWLRRRRRQAADAG